MVVPADERDRRPRLHELGRLGGDGRLLGLFPEGLLFEARLLGAPLGEHGAAVHTLDQSVTLQCVEIPADGHLGNEEGLAQFGQPHPALGLELLQDLFTPHAG